MNSKLDRRPTSKICRRSKRSLSRTYLMVHKDVKEDSILFGKKKIFGNYNSLD